MKSDRTSLTPKISGKQSGFTLLEVMIAVAIIAILAAIAIPSYTEHVTRSRLSEAFTALSVAQASSERYWSAQRTFANFNSSGAWPPNTSTFTYALSNATAQTYTITATGIGAMAGFVYTINQDGNRTTTGVKAGWSGAGSPCWVMKSSGDCVQ